MTRAVTAKVVRAVSLDHGDGERTTSGPRQPAGVPWYLCWARGLALAGVVGGLLGLPALLAASLDGWLQATLPEWVSAGRLAVGVLGLGWLAVAPLIVYRCVMDLARRWQVPA